ncbi:G1/S-specific cyclin-D2-like [Limulus polyphemus]|uniref:G1/S-specific cyclin-D2-like n=1 Tax=Limulus polyphemus TaxID=6850 RepID=A0ABM1S0L5_LIMPO|nr:G1/S-specific cyclin-D2-like [Limulus polyphemus]
MDLMCCEGKIETKAYQDPVLCSDKTLQNALRLEDRYTVTSSYFGCFQKELKLYMRKIVTTWMWEVCEDEQCQKDVFPLAINCLDRFLCVVQIRKSQLQLVGAVCLFLASKVRQTRPILSEKLCAYTDNSVTLDELLNWELLVLSRLKWDISAVVPNDFIEPIFQRLSLARGSEVARNHAETFIDLCCIDFKFSMYPPSMIAAASFGAAVQGLLWVDKQWSSQKELLTRLHQILGIEVDCLRLCLEQIEEMLNLNLTSTQVAQVVPSSVKNSNKLVSVEDLENIKSVTPTDIQDVHF